MTLTRNVFRELRPLFRALEEAPFGGFPSPRFALARPEHLWQSLSRDHTLPSFDITEKGNTYVVEADVPGLKKEHLDITIGDNGRSVTVVGRTDTPALDKSTTSAEEAATAPTPQTRRHLAERENYHSSFSRTFWLPSTVKSAEVQAKLTDGVLTLTIPKVEASEAVKVQITDN